MRDRRYFRQPIRESRLCTKSVGRRKLEPVGGLRAVIKYLATHDEKCVGCLACASACSRLYFQDENPSKSRIVVENCHEGAFHLLVCDQKCEACMRECPARALYRGKNGALAIDPKKCVGCLACVAACPIGAMRWYPNLGTPFKCISCGACARACPKDAIEIAAMEAGA